MDLRYELIKNNFFNTCISNGMQEVFPSSLLPEDDKTVYFTSATITPLKTMLMRGLIPEDGVFLHQQCLRLQKLNEPFYDGMKIRYPGYFNMLGTLVPGNRVVDFQDVVTKIILSQNISPDNVKVDASRKDSMLVERFQKYFPVQYDTRAEKSYNWVYGLGDSVRGRGITFYLRQNTGEYKRIGQYIAIYNAGSLIGCEYGVGIEVLLARTRQYKNEYEAFSIGPILQRYNLKNNFANSHIFSTVGSIYSTGISLKDNPREGYKKILSKALLNMVVLKRKYSLSDDLIISILRDFMQVEFGSSKWLNILFMDFKNEELRLNEQINRANNFIKNQIYLGKNKQYIDAKIATTYPLYVRYQDILSK